MSDYTKRNLTHQGDAEKALLGVFERLAGHFRESFIHGLPETELEDALLWCPIDPSERRIDPQTWDPLFHKLELALLGWTRGIPLGSRKMLSLPPAFSLLFYGMTRGRIPWKKNRVLRGPSTEL
jgi:hypothetical protein